VIHAGDDDDAVERDTAGMDPDTTGVRIEQDGMVARITLCRPEQLNPLDDAVQRSLLAELQRLEERPDVRVVVLSGEGRAFSAGADLRRTAYPPLEGDWATRRHLTGTWQRLLATLQRIPQATVARLHGHVIGGAALLAVACDLRIGGSDTTVRIPELAIGIPLTWSGVPLLVREIGLPLTRDWVMTCRPVAGDELLRAGYLQRLAAPGELDDEVNRCIEQLLAVPPGPLAMTRAMTAAIGASAPMMLAGWGDADLQQWSFTEQEYRDAARAYVSERRPPASSA
jgi:enoyl-CoA hydratase/carnithine racemase